MMILRGSRGLTAIDGSPSEDLTGRGRNPQASRNGVAPVTRRVCAPPDDEATAVDSRRHPTTAVARAACCKRCPLSCISVEIGHPRTIPRIGVATLAFGYGGCRQSKHWGGTLMRCQHGTARTTRVGSQPEPRREEDDNDVATQAR